MRFAKILLRLFVLMFIKDIHLKFSFLSVSLSGLSIIASVFIKDIGVKFSFFMCLFLVWV